MTEHSAEIEYLVIEGRALNDLKSRVQQAARHGFKLQGGISIAERNEATGLWYAQAMVRECDPEVVGR